MTQLNSQHNSMLRFRRLGMVCVIWGARGDVFV